MPPRLQLLSRATAFAPKASYQPVAPFLYPLLQQRRAASILNSLSDTPGSYNKRIRRGRGPSSGKGKTSGRGHKGQKQHGKVPTGFNGGQTPDEVVSGSRGFVNPFSLDMSPINLNRIQSWIDQGRLNPTKPITLKELNRSRCLHGVKDGVKLLARGKEELRTPIHLVVSRASAEAIAAVEKCGGSVTTRYYSKFAIAQIMKGNMDPIHSQQSQIEIPPTSTSTGQDAETTAVPSTSTRKQYKYRLPDPARRKHLEYYRDPAHRGYLSHLVKEGHGPSLFFRTPGLDTKTNRGPKAGRQGSSGSAESRLW